MIPTTENGVSCYYTHSQKYKSPGLISYRAHEEEPRETAHKRKDDAPPRARAVVLAVLVVLVAAFTTRAIVLPSTLADLGSSVPRNVVVFYDEYPTRGDPEYQVTKEIARPLVAHLDKRGVPTDWMFDSIILYNVWLVWHNKPTQTYIDTWINYLFDGGQIANLDATVAEAKASMNRPAYQMNVILSLPVAYSAVSASSILQNLDKLLARWQMSSFSNLRLVGFYWGYTEDLCDNPGQQSPLLMTIIPVVADYAHSKGLKLFNAPWRDSCHYQELKTLGFDYIAMSPNYYMSADLKAFSDVNDAISAGFVDGVNFELPISESQLVLDWRVNLQTYFEQAYLNNWGSNKFALYYHGTTISQMGRNPDIDYRTAYETIYNYVRSTRESSISIESKTVSGLELSGVTVSYDGRYNMTPFSLTPEGTHRLDAPSRPTINGALYSFVGWQDAVGATVSIGTSLTCDVQSAGKTFYAVYGPPQANSVQVSLDARLDTSSSPPTVEILGSIYPAPGGPLNVTLEFSNNQGGTYQEMTRITSAADGTFSYSWKAPGNGEFMIRADVQGVKSSAVSIGTSSGVPGFPLESLAAGCALGLLLAMRRRAFEKMNRLHLKNDKSDRTKETVHKAYSTLQGESPKWRVGTTAIPKILHLVHRLLGQDEEHGPACHGRFP